jgi:uncharacterized protein YqgQ
VLGGFGSLAVASVGIAASLGIVALAIGKLYIEYTKVEGLADSVSKSIDKNAASYLKEKFSIDKLIAASNNMALSIEDRQKAYNKLVSDYPDYFKALDIEEGKVVDVVGRYDELIAKLQEVARVRATEKILQDLEEEKQKLVLEVSAMFPGLTLEEIQEKIEQIATESNKTFGDRLKNNLSEMLQQLGLVDKDWLNVENQLDQINAIERQIKKYAKMGIKAPLDIDNAPENTDTNTTFSSGNTEKELSILEQIKADFEKESKELKSLYDDNLIDLEEYMASYDSTIKTARIDLSKNGLSNTDFFKDLGSKGNATTISLALLKGADAEADAYKLSLIHI